MGGSWSATLQLIPFILEEKRVCLNDNPSVIGALGKKVWDTIRKPSILVAEAEAGKTFNTQVIIIQTYLGFHT